MPVQFHHSLDPLLSNHSIRWSDLRASGVRRGYVDFYEIRPNPPHYGVVVYPDGSWVVWGAVDKEGKALDHERGLMEVEQFINEEYCRWLELGLADLDATRAILVERLLALSKGRMVG